MLIVMSDFLAKATGIRKWGPHASQYGAHPDAR